MQLSTNSNDDAGEGSIVRVSANKCIPFASVWAQCECVRLSVRMGVFVCVRIVSSFWRLRVCVCIAVQIWCKRLQQKDRDQRRLITVSGDGNDWADGNYEGDSNDYECETHGESDGSDGDGERMGVMGMARVVVMLLTKRHLNCGESRISSGLFHFFDLFYLLKLDASPPDPVQQIRFAGPFHLLHTHPPLRKKSDRFRAPLKRSGRCKSWPTKK